MRLLNLNKRILIAKYINNKQSANRIARDMNCSSKTVLNYLRKYNIKIRNNSKAHIIHGKTLTVNYCLDCGKKINWQSKKCLSCSHKGIANASYKGGLPKCLNCGKELKNRKAFRCSSCAGKTRWQDKQYKERMVKNILKGNNIKQNKVEKVLDKLLNKVLLNNYKFVGDGKVIIDGFNPDFVNVNGQKKIIEMFGDYWHNLPTWKKRDKRRIKSYKKYGYNTLIIWQHELKDLIKLKHRILEFDKC